MLEQWRRWRENRRMRRLTRGAERIDDPEGQRRRMLEMSHGAAEFTVVVTPQAGRPMFDNLPDILEGLPPDAKATIILAIPKDFQPDAATKEALRRIDAIAQARHRPELGMIAEDDQDLASLNLELKGPAEFNNLVVFIEDPRNPNLYWFRKVGIERGAMKPEGMEREVPYVDLKRYDMGDFESNPCQASLLDNAIANMTTMERELAKHEDPKMRAMQGVVGVARYSGANKPSLEQILTLTAVKYSRMQATPASPTP